MTNLHHVQEIPAIARHTRGGDYCDYPWPDRAANSTMPPLPDSAVKHLSEAVQIPTISISDTSNIDTAAFLAFKSFLEKCYLLIHHGLSLNMVRQFANIFE